MSVSAEGRLWISETPGPAQLEALQRRGVALVLDVRDTDALKDDQLESGCSARGLQYSRLYRVENDQLTDSLVDRLLAVLKQRKGESMLLVGDDLCTAACLLAVHRIMNEKIPLHAAIAEARLCGMKPGDPETFVRRQAVRLRNPLGS